MFAQPVHVKDMWLTNERIRIVSVSRVATLYFESVAGSYISRHECLYSWGVWAPGPRCSVMRLEWIIPSSGAERRHRQQPQREKKWSSASDKVDFSSLRDDFMSCGTIYPLDEADVNDFPLWCWCWNGSERDALTGRFSPLRAASPLITCGLRFTDHPRD